MPRNKSRPAHAKRSSAESGGPPGRGGHRTTIEGCCPASSSQHQHSCFPVLLDANLIAPRAHFDLSSTVRLSSTFPSSQCSVILRTRAPGAPQPHQRTRGKRGEGSASYNASIRTAMGAPCLASGVPGDRSSSLGWLETWESNELQPAVLGAPSKLRLGGIART